MKEDRENMGNSSVTSPERVAWLIAGWLRQTLREKEHDELDDWVTASDDNQRLFEEMINPANIEQGIKEMKGIDTDEMLKRIKEKVPFSKKPKATKARNRWAYGIAASVILLLGAFMVFQLFTKNGKNNIVVTETGTIQPGGNKATLTLTNGKTINLVEAKNGLLDSTGRSDVLKIAEGQLSYESTRKQEGKGDHILTTPVGGQYNVTLPDGTRVWLNAKSSLKYPAVFDEKERIVELSGEAYFEVVPHPQPLSTGGEGGSKTPFIVKLTNGAQVEVLGTHFNINAYDDEQYIQTTLLSGSVRVKSIHKESMLSPGEQGRIGVGGEWSVVSGVDTSMAVAWKNGKFQFKDAPIETVMRQVARWYDAEIVYEGKVDFHFNATAIYRSEPLSKLLEVLEATERVHFRIEGRRVMVKP